MGGNLNAHVLGIIVAVLGAVLSIGVLTFASGCVHDDGSISTCHAAQTAIAVAGAAVVVLSIAAMVRGTSKTSGVLFVVAAACGLFAAFAPGTVFPLCMMATMRCHLIMQPFAQFVGIAIAALALVAGIRALRARS